MTRFGTTTHLLALLAASSTTTITAFSPPAALPATTRLSATANEDTDFDAPIPKNPQHAHALDHDIVVVDDECYLGKYGQYPDCVDFDPMHNVEINAKAESEMPDFSNLGEEIMAIFKKSPFGKLFAE
mmetsp:Transcript_1473/g.2219  ORF Transcript_1473/g.2219 Transcript_1473/m.2219 type:complete len:128 (+) Transcript_1473:106-489(+)|eukprot:CAMPEP_0196209936 /NCGR_PEP_ID=MMETSP0912-20130531/9971_1 /TAXON_ID=49265 /ORGANISM="Thalassiosira rotula, Strain GSO102" /LENGTH=127 /DNA_ID=CAMNT_0041484929 /DNA_START=45 /DNA_END=428 /DNA_ORIENTATION=+